MKKKLKIIIADDNETLIELMKMKIKQDNRFEVVGTAKDVEEEIKLIKEIKPDLVITDLRKNNEYSGLNVIEEFISKKDKPVFFIVSATTIEYIKEIRKLGIKYYINKPFTDDNFFMNLDYIYDDIYSE